MVILIVLDQVDLGGVWQFAARNVVLVSAILMPAGFFLSRLIGLLCSRACPCACASRLNWYV
jgi:hypothetical protein